MSYTSKQDCYESKFKKVQTNSRYPHFKQSIYTVGDEDQFDTLLPESSIDKKTLEVSSSNLFHQTKMNFWSGYAYQERINVVNTFRYIFYKFKKGIFVRIKDRQVSMFVPMSNAHFMNEWSDLISKDFEVFKRVSELDNRPFVEKNVNKFIRNWYSNNCLIRYEYPINESDTNVSNIYDYFKELCEHREIPDIEFFVNKRDFPLLTTNHTEPYYDIWGKDKPLVSHRYENYLPILSMSKTEDYADVLIPTHEDWARVCQKEGVFYVDARVSDVDEKMDDFKSKIPTAMFRGSSTGDGFTVETNTRLKLAHLSSKEKRDVDGTLFLNCGITKWNSRCKKLRDSTKLQVIDPSSFEFGLVNFLSLEEQRKYKYIVHVDGHVSAFRLATMMSLNCCLLIVESKWKLWYSDLLIPYEHYVPVKADLSDLYEQITWCKENDDSCEYIANNSVEFVKKYLGKEGLLDYGEKVLKELKMFMTYADDIEVKSKETECLFEEYDELNDETMGQMNVLYSNKNVEVLGNGYSTMVKKIPKMNKKHDYGCLKVLNDLAQRYPNFCNTYAVCPRDNGIWMSRVHGVKMYDYLQDKTNFDFRVYLDVLYDLSLCLERCQRYCLFVHNDLTPWNIILEMYSDGNVIPVMIDYDKCHVIDEDYIHRGVNQYNFSSIQDILSILFTSLYQIISNHTLDHFEIRSVLLIANFIAETEFFPGKFRSISELKSYLYTMKKHSSLLYSDKKDMEKKSPYDFCEYMRKNIRHNFKGRCSPERREKVNDKDSYSFDKYITWSPKKFLELKDRVTKAPGRLYKETKQSKKNEADIRTFLYKYLL